MQAPFLAMIVPVSGGGEPTHPIYYPPGIWGPTDPRPTNPIAGIPGLPGYTPPQPPLGIWGPPTMPPGFWGGGMGPGVKPQPHPEHPIYFPPPGSRPPLGIWGPPTMPPGFWGGGMGPGVKPQPHPEHPIVLPPNLPPEIPPPEGGGPAIPIDWKVGWTEQSGWIVVGVPTGPHPAPSA
jgi:hypothetical protein